MSVPFNAGEVLEMAQEIERNGRRFYLRAAEGADDAETRSLLLDLAAMEAAHERTFAAMGEELKEAESPVAVYDPDGEATRYLRAAAGGHVFASREDPAAWLGEGRPLRGVLEKAMRMEKESIVFYAGLRGVVPEALGQDRIDAVIREELQHLLQLGERLALVPREGARPGEN